MGAAANGTAKATIAVDNNPLSIACLIISFAYLLRFFGRTGTAGGDPFDTVLIRLIAGEDC